MEHNFHFSERFRQICYGDVPRSSEVFVCNPVIIRLLIADKMIIRLLIADKIRKFMGENGNFNAAKFNLLKK
jgi:hypothetical protein